MPATPKRAANEATMPLSKAAAFRRMLTSPELEFIMEAHDGISAKIVEEAGFKGIWGSGLSLSAALGVRDNNEASWTQVLEMLEFMSDATSVPILVDGDTGYGNFNNARRVVRKLCQRNVAAICIEDKLFPKTNSFIGENQPLADIDEFCGKIMAAKDSQTDPDFSVVARVEALISGWGMDEALRRAHAYVDAGADAILIHSKKSTADEVLEFTREFANRAPVVIVPTKYYATPTEEFRKAGISLIIWANHNLRAAISAMREVSRRLMREESLAGVEPVVASLKDVFELTGDEELAEAERRYLPSPREAVRGVVLAASRGAALGKLTEDRPKCMIDVRGQPLLRRLVATLKEGGVKDVTVVRGYRKEMINLPGIRTVDNDFYANTGEAASLACAAEAIRGECVLAYGDILFRHYILDRLMGAEGDIVVTVDALWRDRRPSGEDWVRDLVACDRHFSTHYLDDDPVRVVAMGNQLDQDSVSGEWMGLCKLSPRGADVMRAELEVMKNDGTLGRAGLVDVFNRLVEAGHDIRVLYIAGQWLDVDTATDLTQACEFL